MFEIIALLLTLICIEIFVLKETFWGSLLPLTAYILFLNFYVKVNVLTWTLTNLPLLFYSLIIYTIIGVVWSVYKWYRYTSNYYKENPYSKNIDDFNKKYLIIGWISWWPFSVAAELVHEPFNIAYEYASKIYESIEKSAKNKYQVKEEKPKTSERRIL